MPWLSTRDVVGAGLVLEHHPVAIAAAAAAVHVHAQPDVGIGLVLGELAQLGRRRIGEAHERRLDLGAIGRVCGVCVVCGWVSIIE